MKKLSTICAVVTMILAVSGVARAVNVFEDDYSNAAQAGHYETDRANPGGFTVNNNDDGVLTISVLSTDAAGQTSGFYNFHGIVTGPVGDLGAPRGATVTVDLYVPSSWDVATAKRAGDLWARIDDPNQTPGNDYYPTIGIYNYADGNGALVSMFSGSAGGFDGDTGTSDSLYDRYDIPITFDGWNQLGLRYTATGVDYLFNGQVVGADNDSGYQTTLNLDGVLLQGWQGEVDYTATFDNLVVTPEPATMSLLALGGLAVLKRRRKK